MEALLQLGDLKRRNRLFDEAYAFYDEARKLAEHQGELGRLKRINCIIGVIVGEERLVDHFRDVKGRVRKYSRSSGTRE
jgi:hypothetical protein